MTTETKTQEVEITDWDDFQDGDTVVRQPTEGGWGAFIVRREVPTPPRPEPGTFGTALVDGSRIHGLIDEDSDFKYLEWTGKWVEDAYTTHFSDFVPDGSPTEEFERGKEAAFTAVEEVNLYGSPSSAYTENSHDGGWHSGALAAARTAIVKAARTYLQNGEDK
jgi:hypothetical protein